MSKMVSYGDSYEQPRKSTLLFALKIFGYSVLAGIMSIFVMFSISFVAESALTEQVGYYEYRVIDEATNETTILNKVLFSETTTTLEEMTTTTLSETTTTDVSNTTAADGVISTTTAATSVASEETTTTADPSAMKLAVFEPKSEAASVVLTIVDVINQLLLASMLVMMTGYYIYSEGDRDRNLVKHHQREETPWRGLVIGLLAAIPSAVIALLPILGKFGVMSDSVLGVYNTFNPCFLPLINAVIPAEMESATELGVGQIAVIVLIWLVLPITGAVAYRLGYHRVFKKKKRK